MVVVICFLSFVCMAWDSTGLMILLSVSKFSFGRHFTSLLIVNYIQVLRTLVKSGVGEKDSGGLLIIEGFV